jgi:hypothetical protein
LSATLRRPDAVRGPSDPLVRRKVRRAFPVGALATFLLLIALAGCSSQQLYGAGPAWQRNECLRIADESARSRCLSNASIPHDQYERDSKAVSERK